MWEMTSIGETSAERMTTLKEERGLSNAEAHHNYPVAFFLIALTTSFTPLLMSFCPSTNDNKMKTGPNVQQVTLLGEAEKFFIQFLTGHWAGNSIDVESLLGGFVLHLFISVCIPKGKIWLLISLLSLRP